MVEFEPLLDSIFKKYHIPIIHRTNIEGKRYYEINPVYQDNERLRIYKSVTTFLKEMLNDDMAWLEDWRQRIGVRKADNITNYSSSFGSAMHENLEYCIKNDRYRSITYDVLLNELNNDNMEHIESTVIKCDKAVEDMLQTVEDKFSVVYAMENYVFSDKFKTAGAFDGLGKLKSGATTIIDFKNSRSFKKPEWIQSYFYQVFIYACALRQMLFQYVRPFCDDIEWEDILNKLCPTHYSIIIYNRNDKNKDLPFIQYFGGELSSIKNKFIKDYDNYLKRN